MVETKIRSSAIMPIKSSHTIVELDITTDGESLSWGASLGKAYKSVQVLGVGVLNRNSTNYTGAVHVRIMDNASFSLSAGATTGASPRITVTLVCEV